MDSLVTVRVRLCIHVGVVGSYGAMNARDYIDISIGEILRLITGHSLRKRGFFLYTLFGIDWLFECRR
jgi:hypothetical protein